MHLQLCAGVKGAHHSKSGTFLWLVASSCSDVGPFGLSLYHFWHGVKKQYRLSAVM